MSSYNSAFSLKTFIRNEVKGPPSTFDLLAHSMSDLKVSEDNVSPVCVVLGISNKIYYHSYVPITLLFHSDISC